MESLQPVRQVFDDSSFLVYQLLNFHFRFVTRPIRGIQGQILAKFSVIFRAQLGTL